MVKFDSSSHSISCYKKEIGTLPMVPLTQVKGDYLFLKL